MTADHTELNIVRKGAELTYWLPAEAYERLRTALDNGETGRREEDLFWTGGKVCFLMETVTEIIFVPSSMTEEIDAHKAQERALGNDS